jgi:hypothetical protein
MNYHCFIAQVMRIVRATFGQEPMVTEHQVPEGSQTFGGGLARGHAT